VSNYQVNLITRQADYLYSAVVVQMILSHLNWMFWFETQSQLNQNGSDDLVHDPGCFILAPRQEMTIQLASFQDNDRF
jgi:hypothetical protein